MAKQRRTKGSGSVFRDSKGYWVYRTERGTDFVTGKRLPPIKTRRKDKIAAREAHRLKVEAYEKGNLGDTTSRMTVGEWADMLLEADRPNLKPTTVASRRNTNTHIKEVMGAVRLSDVSERHVRMALKAWKDASPATMRMWFSHMSGIFERAVDRDLIRRNPCRLVKPLRQSEKRREVLGPDGPARLIAALRELESDDVWALLCELAFSRGMRAGERYALMPFQLETRHGVHSVNVCQQLQWLGGGCGDSLVAGCDPYSWGRVADVVEDAEQLPFRAVVGWLVGPPVGSYSVERNRRA